MIKIVCWNIKNNKRESWEKLRDMEDADVALLQEAGKPPSGLYPSCILGGQAPWEPWKKQDLDGRPRGAAVARLSDRVEVEWFKRVFPFETPKCDELPVSGIAMIAAAKVRSRDTGQEPFIAVSMCADWLQRHPTTGRSKWIYSDASAHRIISDLSTFIGHKDPSRHRILAAGDLNIIYGATDGNRLALPARERTVFKRMKALGLKFVGPQYPHGRRACPSGLPEDTKNVRTFHTGDQLDYVFASKGFHESVTVRAMNGVDKDEWGPSQGNRT